MTDFVDEPIFTVDIKADQQRIVGTNSFLQGVLVVAEPKIVIHPSLQKELQAIWGKLSEELVDFLTKNSQALDREAHSN